MQRHTGTPQTDSHYANKPQTPTQRRHTHTTQHNTKIQRLTQADRQHHPTTDTCMYLCKTTHVPQTHRHSLEASIQHTHRDTDHRTPPATHTHNTYTQMQSDTHTQKCIEVRATHTHTQRKRTGRDHTMELQMRDKHPVSTQTHACYHTHISTDTHINALKHTHKQNTQTYRHTHTHTGTVTRARPLLVFGRTVSVYHLAQSPPSFPLPPSLCLAPCISCESLVHAVKTLTNNQSKKDMETLIRANLRMITQETVSHL